MRPPCPLGLVASMADNKVAEDVHASIRLASKSNSNEKLSDTTIQDVISHSRVLEKREISHDVAVPKETFIAEVNQTSLKSKWKHHHASIKQSTNCLKGTTKL